MKQIEPWKTYTFIGTLLVLALIINNSRGSKNPPSGPYSESSGPRFETAPVPSGPTAEELAAAEREKLIARYLETRLTARPGKRMIAVAALSDAGRIDDHLAELVGGCLKSDALDLTVSPFTQEFAADGHFATLFSGSRSILHQLELTNVIETVLLARQSVNYVSNPELENVLTAQMRLELVALPAKAKAEPRTLAFQAVGAGFKEKDARQLAQDRLLKQISKEEASILKLISHTKN